LKTICNFQKKTIISSTWNSYFDFPTTNFVGATVERQAEKKDILKSLVVPGKRAATMQKIRSRELPEILHQVLDT
jgi:hypothetical protein